MAGVTTPRIQAPAGGLACSLSRNVEALLSPSCPPFPVVLSWPACIAPVDADSGGGVS